MEELREEAQKTYKGYEQRIFNIELNHDEHVEQLHKQVIFNHDLANRVVGNDDEEYFRA